MLKIVLLLLLLFMMNSSQCFPSEQLTRVISLIKGNSQVTLVVDIVPSNDQYILHTQLLTSGVAVSVFKVNELLQLEMDHMANTPCPVFLSYEAKSENHTQEIEIPESTIYIRKNVAKEIKNSRMFIFWLNSTSLKMGLEILSQSVLHCKQYIHPGHFHQDNKLLFLTNSHKDTLIVFDHPLVKRHSQTAVLEQFHGRFALFRLWGFIKMLHSDSTKKEVSSVFAPPKDYTGFTMRGAGYIYAYDTNTDPTVGKTGIAKHGDYWGAEIEMLIFAEQHLKFNLTFESPQPEDWGSINVESGKWTGSLGLVTQDELDITTSCAYSYNRFQIVNPVRVVDFDYLGWVAPPPMPVASFTKFLTPLDSIVWVLTLICSLIFGILIFYIVNVEHKLTHTKYKGFWRNPFESWCWCLGVLLGEYIIPVMQIRTEKFPSIRLLLCTWSIGCLIISQSYAGNLKAHLTTPTLGKPIDTLKEVLESGIMVTTIEYGEEENQLLETSTDPVISTIWNRRVEIFGIPANISQVYHGEMIIFAWLLGMRAEVLKYYFNPKTGKPLLHISSKPIYTKKWQSFCVNKMSPWAHQLDDIIQRAIEIGLPTFWRLRVLRQQVMNDLARGEPPVKLDDESLSRPLNIQDVQGALVLYPVIVLLVSLVAVVEFIYGYIYT